VSGVERSGKDVASFLRRVADGLETAPTKEQAQAVRAAVNALPKDAVLTGAALDRLGVDEGLRAAVTFQLLAKRYPSELGSKARLSTSISEVLMDLAGGDLDQIEEGDDQVPEFLAEFIADLESTDERLGKTGVAVLAGEHSDHQLESVDKTTQSIAISAKIGRKRERAELTRGAEGWTVSADDERHPLSDVDLGSLKTMRELLLPMSAKARDADPLMAVHLEALEQDEGGLYPDLLARLEEAIQAKEVARNAHLEQIDAALRKHLGAYRVGQAPQADVNAMAEKALEKRR
jgi:hypothetical protein